MPEITIISNHHHKNITILTTFIPHFTNEDQNQNQKF